MACVLQIGAGGVGGVVAHKMAMNKEVFSRIVLASRNIAKCAAIADSIRAKGLGEIEIDKVDADNVDEIVALIEKYKPFLVVNVALPYQDLSIMEACLRTKTHYLDTANYEHPDSAHFEYKEQWAYDTRYKQAGIFALLGSGFDPGVTNVFCAYAQKHYFDEIHTIDILDCNAGDHGYAFATNFNPEINLREVSSKARYWIKGHSAFSEKSGSLIVGGGHYPLGNSLASNPHNPDFSSKILECQKGGASQENLTQDTRIAESGTDSRLSISIVPYEPSMLPAMLEIWEDSVRASHFFLKDNDIVEIKEEAKGAFAFLQNILVAKVGGEFAGFIGVSEKMIEMLFASPKFFNLGLGKRLILEACNAFFAKQDEILVDCNEQNERGLKFYQKLGFKQLGRSEKDSSGRDFAIIHFSITKAELLNKLNSLDFNIKANLALNPDLKKDEIYRKFEREEKHFKLESNTQDLKNESYFGGEWKDIAPLALMKEWEYPEVGVKNSYLLYHEELESLIRNIKGLRKIRFFMTFGESYLTHMKCLENVGLLRVDEVEHNGQKIVPIQVLKTLLPDPASLAPRTKGQTHIGCYIKGMKDGKERTIYIYNICEHEACYKEVNAQGVSYTTGVPAMIGAKLICEGKWGVGAVKNSSLGGHSVLSDKSGNLHSDFRSFASSKLPQSSLDNPLFSSQSLECQQGADSKTQQSLTQDTRIAESNYTQERLALNADMPQGGEYQGIDSNNGSGVWNMEQNDPDPFMRELNKQGLPYVVLEIDSNGDSKVLEDGRK
ncbi:GNAT family N-acetyltransferase [Helicobacter pullorum]|uniref:GNAT family N-acetyltransferase n=1 Tax=Helicobacter pullorum TaxID=35818 RepID=UPI00255D101D|nr:GNAT family N-acetyltransferase [Helicobacter pullorum]